MFWDVLGMSVFVEGGGGLPAARALPETVYICIHMLMFGLQGCMCTRKYVYVCVYIYIYKTCCYESYWVGCYKV